MIMNAKEIYGNLLETRYFNLGQLTVVFTEELADELLDPKTEKIARKFLNSLRYGYIGLSHGGRNGITAITERDHKIFSDFNRFRDTERYGSLLQLEELVNPIGVKVVAHIPTGERMVGLLDVINEKVVFYEIGKY